MTATLDEAAGAVPRMANPFELIPEVRDAVFRIAAATQGHGLPLTTSRLAQLRAAQLNDCTFCVGRKTAELSDAEERESRIAAVSTWPEATCFTDAERAALALAEVMTRLPQPGAPAWDEAWSAVSRHFEEQALAALVIDIALLNMASRVFVATAQAACPVMPSAGSR
jgi:AhpD family alkylhydroperoxidase